MSEEKAGELRQQAIAEENKKTETRAEIERLTEMAALLEKQLSIMETRVKEKKEENKEAKREVRKMQDVLRRYGDK